MSCCFLVNEMDEQVVHLYTQGLGFHTSFTVCERLAVSSPLLTPSSIEPIHPKRYRQGLISKWLTSTEGTSRVPDTPHLSNEPRPPTHQVADDHRQRQTHCFHLEIFQNRFSYYTTNNLKNQKTATNRGINIYNATGDLEYLEYLIMQPSLFKISLSLSLFTSINYVRKKKSKNYIPSFVYYSYFNNISPNGPWK